MVALIFLVFSFVAAPFDLELACALLTLPTSSSLPCFKALMPSLTHVCSVASLRKMLMLFLFLFLYVSNYASTWASASHLWLPLCTERSAIRKNMPSCGRCSAEHRLLAAGEARHSERQMLPMPRVVCYCHAVSLSEHWKARHFGVLRFKGDRPIYLWPKQVFLVLPNTGRSAEIMWGYGNGGTPAGQLVAYYEWLVSRPRSGNISLPTEVFRPKIDEGCTFWNEEHHSKMFFSAHSASASLSFGGR